MGPSMIPEKMRAVIYQAIKKLKSYFMAAANMARYSARKLASKRCAPYVRTKQETC
ncbi:hypothetical protein AGR13a_Cc30127 [Agrobacterium genomosp. 13 str. CFBP 6927]|uniref:Transposase n=1 Tax=Agrobacterium genomosp. 13 str. CFBP 6927 TaxID=1183428 RepID=A0ABM9VFK9_9HYPH|nr:hypothetical protein AGR13a_Cc30127 [Agrobacterium genomosp. 13 str. CFBP 6927]